jgi:hypothetical protein
VTDADLHQMAVIIMAATWIKNQAKEMVPREDLIRLALAVSKVSIEETTVTASKMLRALSDADLQRPTMLCLLPGGKP